MGDRKNKAWTEEEVEAEIEALRPKDETEVQFQGVRQPRKKGRPKKFETIKTNLDLTEHLLDQLDVIATENGLNRQALIKHFILNGLSEYYKTSSLKK